MPRNKKQIIVEVGSTVTKVDLYDGKFVKRIKEQTIFFKKHYKEVGKILEEDLLKLIELVNGLKEETEKIYVCGTSLFRELGEEKKEDFLTRFKEQTQIEFYIISQEEESELTVLGVTQRVSSKVCVFVGGGGSTEITIYDGKIKESINTNIGVIDVLEKFPDLKEDLAKTSLSEVKKYIKEHLNLPKEKADVLILAGGGHEKFARSVPFHYEKNILFQDELASIMMDISLREKETENYYQEVSLKDIKKRVEDPNWWDATRAMCAFVLVVAESLNAKYIVPTNVGMVYGILSKLEKKKNLAICKILLA